MDDDVRALGTILDVHGDPLTVAVWHGRVNIAGRMLDQAQYEQFMQLAVRAGWEAARHEAARDA